MCNFYSITRSQEAMRDSSTSRTAGRGTCRRCPAFPHHAGADRPLGRRARRFEVMRCAGVNSWNGYERSHHAPDGRLRRPGGDRRDRRLSRPGAVRLAF